MSSSRYIRNFNRAIELSRLFCPKGKKDLFTFSEEIVGRLNKNKIPCFVGGKLALSPFVSSERSQRILNDMKEDVSFHVPCSFMNLSARGNNERRIHDSLKYGLGLVNNIDVFEYDDDEVSKDTPPAKPYIAKAEFKIDEDGNGWKEDSRFKIYVHNTALFEREVCEGGYCKLSDDDLRKPVLTNALLRKTHPGESNTRDGFSQKCTYLNFVSLNYNIFFQLFECRVRFETKETRTDLVNTLITLSKEDIDFNKIKYYVSVYEKDEFEREMWRRLLEKIDLILTND